MKNVLTTWPSSTRRLTLTASTKPNSRPVFTPLLNDCFINLLIWQLMIMVTYKKNYHGGFLLLFNRLFSFRNLFRSISDGIKVNMIEQSNLLCMNWLDIKVLTIHILWWSLRDPRFDLTGPICAACRDVFKWTRERIFLCFFIWWALLWISGIF